LMLYEKNYNHRQETCNRGEKIYFEAVHYSEELNKYYFGIL
jgi:hypothetical protein